MLRNVFTSVYSRYERLLPPEITDCIHLDERRLTNKGLLLITSCYRTEQSDGLQLNDWAFLDSLGFYYLLTTNTIITIIILKLSSPLSGLSWIIREQIILSGA